MLKGIGLSRARHRLSGTRHPDHDHDRAAIRPADLLPTFSPYFFGASLPAIHLRVSMRSLERWMCS
jgi:hypothetical protein